MICRHIYLDWEPLQRCERRGCFLLRWYVWNARASGWKNRGELGAKPEQADRPTRLRSRPPCHGSASLEARNRIHGISKYNKFHKEDIKMTNISCAEIHRPFYYLMQIIDIDRVVWGGGGPWMARPTRWRCGLNELDTPGLVSVYKSQGNSYISCGIVNSGVWLFCEPMLPGLLCAAQGAARVAIRIGPREPQDTPLQ